MDRLRFVQGNASRRTISDASHRTLFDAPLRLYDQISYGQSVCKYCDHVIAAAATRVLLGPPAPLSYSPSFPYGRRLAPGTAARAERRFRLRAERILRRVRVRGRPRRSPPIASLPRAHQPRAASGGIRARNLDESRPFLSASRGSPFVLGTHGRAPSARVDVASRDI